MSEDSKASLFKIGDKVLIKNKTGDGKDWIIEGIIIRQAGWQKNAWMVKADGLNFMLDEEQMIHVE